jgi:hypothetical protein
MKLTFVPAAAAGLCFALAVPALQASVWNQKTVFTFNEPVEVPGRVLAPGTYVFKLADNESDRNVVQVYSNNQKHLLGTFLAIPDYRLKTPGKPIINFSERAAGSPEAVRAWFYPGDNYGHEFVYPRTEATKLAKVNNEPVASMEDREFHGSSMASGHVRAVKPSGEEVEVIEVFGNAPQTTSNMTPGQPGSSTYGTHSGQSYSGAGNSGGSQSNTGRGTNGR